MRKTIASLIIAVLLLTSPMAFANKANDLFRAIAEADLVAVTNLLKKDSSLAGLKNKDGLTPLMYAASTYTEKQLSSEFEVSVSGSRLSTKGTQRPVVLMLLGAHPDLNATDASGRTALHVAAKNGLMTMVLHLVVSGADIGLKDDDGKAAADLADAAGLHELAGVARGSRKHAAEMLLARLNGPTQTEAGGKPEEVKPTDNPGKLLYAARRDDVGRIEELLRAEPELVKYKDKEGLTALHNAAEYGHSAALEALLAKGADIDCVNRNGETPLYLAAANGHLAAVEALLARKSNVNRKNKQARTPLWIAAKLNRSAVVAKLLDANADHGISDEDRLPPLLIAVKSGSVESAKVLLDKGAPLNTRIKAGYEMNVWKGDRKWGFSVGSWGLLSWGVFSGSLEMVEMLLARGEDPKKKIALVGTMPGFFYESPLQLAACLDHAGIAKLLVERGADVNVCDQMHMRPLHYAAEYGDKDLAAFLVQHGADVNVHNKRNKTPLKIAVEKGQAEIAELLRQAGGKEQ